MADITVTYKGNTIKSVGANSTTTLGTSGKWCEDDITIASSWNYLGANATKISNFADFSVALTNTDYNTWTPSTTAKVILATDTFGTFSADMANYNYVIKWTFWTDLAYNVGATLKVMPYKQRSIATFDTYRTPRYYTDFQANAFNVNRISSVNNVASILYYNSSGTMSVQNSGSYGFYATAGAPTFGSTTADTVTITIPRPVLYARCSTTYMATARASEIDKTNSTLHLRCEVYRIDKNYIWQSKWYEMVDAMNA